MGTPPRQTHCPHCGEELQRGAAFCPECGSDEETGWAEDAEVGLGGAAHDDGDDDWRSDAPDTAAARPRVWRKIAFFGAGALALCGMMLIVVGNGEIAVKLTLLLAAVVVVTNVRLAAPTRDPS